MGLLEKRIVSRFSQLQIRMNSPTMLDQAIEVIENIAVLPACKESLAFHDAQEKAHPFFDLHSPNVSAEFREKWNQSIKVSLFRSHTTLYSYPKQLLSGRGSTTKRHSWKMRDSEPVFKHCSRSRLM